MVGELLAKLDQLGIADNTIVVFATDNGAEKFTWPDGGTSPFRGEKGLGWEGGPRPGHAALARQDPPLAVLNGITLAEDIVPNQRAAAGIPDVKEQPLEGYQAGDKHFRVHLDGYNQLPYLTGETEESPHHEFYYGERELYALRYNNWSTSRPRTTGSAGRRSGPRCRDRSTCATTFEQHMDAPAYPLYAGRSCGPCCPRPPSSSSTWPASPTSHHARHRPGFNPSSDG